MVSIFKLFDKPVLELQKEDIDKLIERGQEENHYLDYKTNFTLNDEGKIVVSEFAKDIAGFSNDGAFLIVGMEERGHKPINAEGIETTFVTRETLDSWLNTSFGGKRPNVFIHPVRFDTDHKTIWIFEIRPDINAPFMVTVGGQHSYYKRCNFQTIPMEDIEVKEMIIRNQTRRERYQEIINTKLEDKLRLSKKFNEYIYSDYLALVAIPTVPLYKKLTLKLDDMKKLFLSGSSTVKYEHIFSGATDWKQADGAMFFFGKKDSRTFKFVEFENDGCFTLLAGIRPENNYTVNFTNLLLEGFSLLQDFYETVGYNGDISTLFEFMVKNPELNIAIDDMGLTDPDLYGIPARGTFKYSERARANPFHISENLSQPINVNNTVQATMDMFFKNLLFEGIRDASKEAIEKYRRLPM